MDPLNSAGHFPSQVCQLCHHLTVIIDGLDKLDVQYYTSTDILG